MSFRDPIARRRRSAAFSVIAIVASLSIVASASAATATKPYSVAFSTNSEAAGVTVTGFTVTLRNDTGTQMMGSANIVVPSAFTLASPPTSTRGTLQGPLDGTLRLRDLNTAPGGVVTVTFDLQLPCVAAGYAWTVNAKQSNDYKGTGNDLGPLSGNLTTTVTSACALRFARQPATAQKNTPIRADALQPASANRVGVEAVDGSQAPQRLRWFTGPITLTRGPTVGPSGSGSLTGSGPVSASGGLAELPDLQIDAAGTYALRASTTAPGFVVGADPLSSEFQIADASSDCTRRSCSAALSGTTISSTSGSDSGFLVLSSNVGIQPVCAGYTPPTGSWFEFGLLPATPAAAISRDSTIALIYTKAQMKSISGQLQVCFAAPLSFTAKDPGLQAFDYDGNPANLAEGFVGLLPDCPALRQSPCVVGRAPLGGGAASITFFVPAAWGADPRYH